MADIKFVRLDSRLIHGQVASQWIPRMNARAVVILDDATAADSFMVDMLQLACPRDTKVIVYSVEDGVNEYKKDAFGNLGNVIVLFQNVDCAYRAFKAGFDFGSLNVAQIPGGPGRVRLPGTTVNMNADEMTKIEEIVNSGVDVGIQLVPNETRQSILPLIQKAR